MDQIRKDEAGPGPQGQDTEIEGAGGPVSRPGLWERVEELDTVRVGGEG